MPHGGTREGSGRPPGTTGRPWSKPKTNKVKTCITLSPEVHERLKRSPNMGFVIDLALRKFWGMDKETK